MLCFCLSRGKIDQAECLNTYTVKPTPVLTKLMMRSSTKPMPSTFQPDISVLAISKWG